MAWIIKNVLSYVKILMMLKFKKQIPFSRKNKKPRILEIDIIRGICIALMIIDHLLFDLGYLIPSIFGITVTSSTPELLSNIIVSCRWYYSEWDVRFYTRQIVICLFLFVSGLSSKFSRSNLDRGVKIFAVGLVISFGSYIFSDISHSDLVIPFGTLSGIGMSIILFSLFELIVDAIDKNRKYSPYIYIVIGIILASIGYSLNLVNNRGHYVTIDNLIETIFGFNRYGADYLGLLPFSGFMFIGSGIGYIIYKNKKSYLGILNDKIRRNNDEFKPNKVVYYIYKPIYYFFYSFSYFGKNSLAVYVIHQGAIIVLLCIIMLCSGYKIHI